MQVQIDPRIAFWFGVWTSILLVVGGGTVSLAHVIPDAWIPTANAWCIFLGAINSIILTACHGYSSPGAGPYAATPLPAVSPAVKALIVFAVMLAALTFPAPALAQPKTASSGFLAKLGADIATRVQQFEQVTVEDLTAAKQIFDAAKNANGSACAASWLVVAQANATVDATSLPAQHLFSLLAKGYNIHVGLQAGSPMRVACAAMMDDFRNSGGGILGGAAAVKNVLPVLALFGL